MIPRPAAAAGRRAATACGSTCTGEGSRRSTIRSGRTPQSCRRRAWSSPSTSITSTRRRQKLLAMVSARNQGVFLPRAAMRHSGWKSVIR